MSSAYPSPPSSGALRADGGAGFGPGPTDFENRAPIAANADPITSHLAAEEITSNGTRDTQKRAVLNALMEEPLNITSMELARRMGVDRHMVAKRLPDLEDDGLVERQPERNCSVTKRKAITWRAAR